MMAFRRTNPFVKKIVLGFVVVFTKHSISGFFFAQPSKFRCNPGSSPTRYTQSCVETPRRNFGVERKSHKNQVENTKESESEKDPDKTDQTNEFPIPINFRDFKIVQATSSALSDTADEVFDKVADGIESLFSDASEALSEATLFSLIQKSKELIIHNETQPEDDQISTGIEPVINFVTTQLLNNSQDTDLSDEDALNMIKTVNGMLRKGYTVTRKGNNLLAYDQDRLEEKANGLMEDVNLPQIVEESKALFASFDTAFELSSSNALEMEMASKMAVLAAAIYREDETIDLVQSVDQTRVAQNITQNIAWMVTEASDVVDSSNNSTSSHFRTLTIRGFDASGESVDGETLLNRICDASPEKLKIGKKTVIVHSGILGIACQIYQEVKPYLEGNRIVLNGHSVGGSVATILLFLYLQEFGLDAVKRDVVKVYTFGSPPIVSMEKKTEKATCEDTCKTLNYLELPASLVFSFVQPWDPVIRLFSDIDALYPLVGDIGDDGITPFAHGPPRASKVLLRSIFDAWNGWPRFRDTFKENVSQNYTSIGVQHIILPDPVRYLSDRYGSANIAAPEAATIVRMSSNELYPALTSLFPLDVFEISYITQTIRSLVHHFSPSYATPLSMWTSKLIEGPIDKDRI